VIAFLHGRLHARGADWAELDVRGIGFRVALSARSAAQLPPVGEEATVLTELVLREEAVQLVGFLSAEEREAFRLLLTVASIGPKTALAILGRFSVPQLTEAIRQEDISALTGVPGVGRKTAQRLCLELKDRLPSTAEPGGGLRSLGGARGEAVAALVSLGYSDQEARQAVEAVDEDGTDDAAGLVRAALRRLGSVR